jgi:hypothetical protein
MSKPSGALVERSYRMQQHLHFDAVPYANIKMVDVARVLDMETSRPTLNMSVITKLLDRVLTGLEHTIIALQGRPEGTRVVGLLHRSFNRVLDRLSADVDESRLTEARDACAFALES